MSKYLSEMLNFRVGLAPAADRWDTSPPTDLFDLSKYESISFYVVQADALVGTANPTVRIQAASDNVGTGAEAIPFKSRKQTDVGTVGALTETSAAGIALDAGDNQTLIAEVKADDLPEGKKWVRALPTEGVDDPAAGAIFVVMGKARYTDGNPESAL